MKSKRIQKTGKKTDEPGECVNGRTALLLQKYDANGGMFLRFSTGPGIDDFIDAEIDYPDLQITINDDDAYLKVNGNGRHYVDVSHRTLGFLECDHVWVHEKDMYQGARELVRCDKCKSVMSRPKR